MYWNALHGCVSLAYEAVPGVDAKPNLRQASQADVNKTTPVSMGGLKRF